MCKCKDRVELVVHVFCLHTEEMKPGCTKGRIWIMALSSKLPVGGHGPNLSDLKVLLLKSWCQIPAYTYTVLGRWF